MSLDTSPSSSTALEIAAARQADSVAFLHRAPFALDAYKLGFLPGFREDCGYQQTQYQNLAIPVGMLDNDFRNPDLDRYVSRFFEYEPQVGVIGDAYEGDDIDEYVAAAREIQASYPDAELVIVPKCREMIGAIPNDLVLGYSRGYADRLAHEFSEPSDWRGRRVHILGGSPPKQRDVIQQLTRPTLTDEPPADIVGLDWNGLHRGAEFGEFWTADGWDDSGRDANHVTVRKTVRHSLARLKAFWESHGVWPNSPPHDDTLEIEYEGPSPTDLDDAACTECGANVWMTRRGPFVTEYDTGALCSYCSYDCYFSHRHRNNLEEIAGEQSVYFPPARRRRTVSRHNPPLVEEQGDDDVLGYTTRIRITGRDGAEETVAKSDTGAKRLSIDTDLAGRIGAGPLVGTTQVRSGTGSDTETRPLVDIDLCLTGRWRTVTASITIDQR